MAPQMSAYIRLSSPPTTVPGYLRMDLSSEWSKSSLLCTAVETVTLPTRLRESSGRQGSLTELESALNKTGSRTVFELQCSVVTREGSVTRTSKETSFPDERRRTLSPTRSTPFDLDYSPRASQTTLGRTPHVFSQVEIRRCIPGTHIPVESKGSDDQDAIVEL